MIADRINNNLSALFNTEDDDIYKALIVDSDGTIPSTISKPTDIDIGVIGAEIEYLRLLGKTLLKQIYLDQAGTDFLEYTLNNYFDSLRLVNESDSEWLTRVTSFVLSQKISRASVIYLLRPYSALEPVVSTDIVDHAFADFSYCDIYSSGSTTLNGDTVFYRAAIVEGADAAIFTYKVTLYNTLYNEIMSVIEMLNKIKAAGITVILEILYT